MYFNLKGNSRKFFDFKRIVELKNKRTAFTVAEMLLVLLIISFLIIALPPLVNKKIVKKVVRGEHGRYECWIDPVDGHTYEYLSTERHGVTALFYNALTGKMGRQLGDNERCRFKPVEMAPTASYFAMQIIGGGGGGAFAPYDGSSAYKVPSYVDKGNVKYYQDRITVGGTDQAFAHTGSDYFNLSFTYAHNKLCNANSCFNWYNSSPQKFPQATAEGQTTTSGLTYFSGCDSKKWIYDYFPPVLNNQDIKICSGHGPRGFSVAWKPGTVRIFNKVETVYDENNQVVSWGEYDYDILIDAQFGGRGGFGYCVTAPANSIALTRDPGSEFNITTESPVNSYDWAAYYSVNFNSTYVPYQTVKFDYEADPNAGGEVQNPGSRWINCTNPDESGGCNLSGHAALSSQYPSYEDNLAHRLTVAACPWTSDGSQNISSGNTPPSEIQVRFTGAGSGGQSCHDFLSRRNRFLGTHYTYIATNPEQQFFSGANRREIRGLGGTMEEVFHRDVVVAMGMGMNVTASQYFPATTQINPETGESEFVPAYTGDAACYIPGGGQGYDADIAQSAIVSQNHFDYEPPHDVTFEEVTPCASLWADMGPNMNQAQNGRKYTIPSAASYRATASSSNLFPIEIQMTRTVSEDTNTFGFAGRPGESVAFYFAKLTGTLEFDIGEGGEAGVYGSREARRGKTGGRTIVWRKSTGVRDSVECQLNDDGTVSDETPGCNILVVAKGGRGYRDGANGKKIVIRGARTCQQKDDDGNWVVAIDGCLDAGVGPAVINGRNGGNKLRFAENSNFYTIPELDKESTTKSAIEEAFKGMNLPGSGGDGGYSFLRQLIGTETIKAVNHNNFNPDSMKSVTGEDWEQVSADTLRAGREISSSELDYSNYRCYLKGDALNDPRKPENRDNRNTPKTAAELGINDSNLADTAFCEPYNGMPGAVVIVW